MEPPCVESCDRRLLRAGGEHAEGRSRGADQEAREYNENLLGQGNARFLPNGEEKKVYNSILDVSGTGIMGYIAIPAIHAKLPIYHGTDETVLQIAAGHYEARASRSAVNPRMR